MTTETDMFYFLAGNYFAYICDILPDNLKEKLNEIDRVKDSIRRREDEPATWLEHIQKELEITNCELSKLKRNKNDKYFILKFIIEKTLNPTIAIEFCKVVDMTEK
jgi:hypothetical protein